MYFSDQQGAPNDSARIVGAIIADAAATGAFEWSDFHDPANVDAFASAVPSTFASFVEGLRHHVMLDHRSHDEWNGGGGYAYVKQTPELVSLVQAACEVDDELGRTLAHNFIETAVDLRLLRDTPLSAERLRIAITSFDVGPVAEAFAAWKHSDVTETERNIEAYLHVWLDHDFSNLDGMVDLWAFLLPVLKRDTFRMDVGPELNRAAAKSAIKLALEIVENDAIDVVSR